MRKLTNGEIMLVGTKKRKPKTTLTENQHRLLKESLKQLLGSGLLQSQSKKHPNPKAAYFLKDALNSQFLNN